MQSKEVNNIKLFCLTSFGFIRRLKCNPKSKQNGRSQISTDRDDHFWRLRLLHDDIDKLPSERKSRWRLVWT